MTARLTLVVVVLLALGAAPAQATLLVRSDGAGASILDKNGLNDRVYVTNVSVGFRIQNDNPDDIFKFDRQIGCHDTGQSDRVDCDDDRPKLNIGLFGGNDVLRLNGVNGAPVPAGVEAVVNAGNGNDDLDGHAGRDQFNGFGGVDKFRGRGGSDHLEGDDGADILTGDDGADAFLGDDGDDTIKAREVGTPAVRDSISCGAGNDYVEADLKDLLPSTCEERDVAAVGETPLVRLPRGRVTVRASRHVRLRLRCPRGVGSIGCKGRLSLRLNVRGARRARKRYEIGAGRSKTVTLRLSRGSARTLRRRQRQGRRTLGVLSSVESGRLGRKTRVRYPRLRLSRR